jgi:hypothetical protein
MYPDGLPRLPEAINEDGAPLVSPNRSILDINLKPKRTTAWL